MFLFNFNNGDPNRPSFFEMFAQHQMMPSFKPALKYIFTVLSQRNPKFEIIVKYHDEFFYSLLLLLEYHYLKYYEGSFSENFYNLKRTHSDESTSGSNRIPLLYKLFPTISKFLVSKFNRSTSSSASINGGVNSSQPTPSTHSTSSPRHSSMMMMMMHHSEPDEPMSIRQKRLSIVFLVFIPYIKSKLDEFYKKESDPINSLGLYNEDDDNNDMVNGNNIVNRVGIRPYVRILIKVFLKVYPFISAFYESMFFIYQLLYLYEYTNYYTPFLHIQKVVLKRLTRQDIESHNSAVAVRRNERIAFVRNWPLTYIFTPIVKILDSILDYSKFILPASVFLFKSLEWWYSENRASPPQMPIPPPPSPPKRAVGGLAIPEDKSKCPLCLNDRTNPALCGGSGFVFCYTCIFNYVQSNEKCPITFIPTTTEQVRKIYEAM